MGNSCRRGLGEDTDSANIDEFYDPFAELNNNVTSDSSVISQHGPRGLMPLS